ncbi:MAG: hypothetical protein ACPGOV_02600 [Magnetovibrionaceae bacterium]
MSKIKSNLDAFIGISDAMTLFGTLPSCAAAETREPEPAVSPAKRDWAEMRLLEGVPAATLARLRSLPGD